ncbi:MAG: hypothetical protein IKG55_03055, partial [Solobacterium sp.]|nr:hypothetical protein [Solobacterium sp.]
MRKKDILFVLRNLIEMHPMRKDAYYGALKTLDLLLIDDKRFFTLPIDPEYVDVNFYDTGQPWDPPEDAYDKYRNITMSKFYYWMEKIKKA